MGETERKLEEIMLKLGLPTALIERAKRKKITLREMRHMTERELALALGVERKIAEMVLAAVEEGMVDIRPAHELAKKRRRLSFGVREIDELLAGGLEQGAIAELYGRPASGKTQIAMQLSVNVQMDEESGGLSSRALFVDTEGGFSPARLAEMARFKVLPQEKVLKRTLHVDARTTRSLSAALKKAIAQIKESGIGLLVVDSLLSPFRLEYSGIKELPRRQQAIARTLRLLRRIADEGAVILITNHVTGKIGGTPGLERYRPAGGYILGHVPELVLMVKKIKGNRRLLSLVDSSYLEEGEALFAISDRGLISV